MTENISGSQERTTYVVIVESSLTLLGYVTVQIMWNILPKCDYL